MINEFYENKKNINNKKNFYLVENPKVILSQGFNVIRNFLNHLRTDIEYCYKFIINCNPLDLQEIAFFLTNNLFDNIFLNDLSDELLCIIYRCLENEINTISGPQFFLEDSNLKILFDALSKNPQIKYFFHLILSPIIEKIENKSHERFFLNINEIIDEYNNNKEKYIYSNIFSQNNIEKKNKEFIEKYFTDISKKDLENLIQNTNDLFIKEYIQKQIDLYEINENLYSCSHINDEINKLNNSKNIFLLYKHIFLEIKRVIDYIIICLNEKIHLMPHSLKKICKMIKLLVNKKHKNCSKLIENLYIGKLFINTFLFNCLKSLDYECLIGSYIISEQTQKNFNNILIILQQLFSFEFFNTTNNFSFIGFNSYFLNDILPYVSKLFDELTNINFTSFLERITKNDNMYYYNFFKENRNEFINYISFCCSTKEIEKLFSISKNNFSPIFEEELESNVETLLNKNRNIQSITINRYTNYSNEINDIFSVEEKNNKNFYFLFTDLKYNDEYSKYDKVEFDECYQRKELSVVITKEELLENNLIKIDNFLIKLLFTYGTLNQRDFTEISSNDLIYLLNELIKILKTGRLNFNSNVPPEWYGKSLINLLINLPNKYKNNNYDGILSSLKSNIEESINFLNPKVFTKLYEKFKFIEEKKEVLNYIEICLLQTEQNKMLKIFFEEQEILNILTLNKTSINSLNTNNTYKIKSISNLIEIFPNVTSKEKSGKNKSFDNQKEDFVPEFIKNFFNVVYDKLIKTNFIEEQDFNELYNNYELNKEELDLKNRNISLLFDGVYEKLKEYMLINYSLFSEENYQFDIKFCVKKFKKQCIEFLIGKVEDYIMNKLFYRIFPFESSHKDMKLYRNSIKFSWIEPKHLTNIKEINKYDFLNEISLNIHNLDNYYSPYSKIKQISKIFKMIEKLIQLNLINDEFYLVNNQVIPIFVYCTIKSKPKKLWSNLIYIDLYHSFGINQQIFCQFQVAVTLLENLCFDNLLNISKEEYDIKCKQSLIK